MMKPKLAVLILPFALAACGDDGGGEDLDVEGCEHLEEGPYEAVTATADTASAPEVADDHTSYTVTLPVATAGNAGFVRFAADEAGDFIFFLDADVDVELTDADGAVVTPEESATSSDACDTIRGKHTVELEVATYFLELSSPTIDEVNVVIEHGAHTH
jgi:hypothetical protein